MGFSITNHLFMGYLHLWIVPSECWLNPPHLDSQAARAVRYGGLKKKEQLGDGSKGLVGSNGDGFVGPKDYPLVI
jgi:hypothetical protein